MGERLKYERERIAKDMKICQRKEKKIQEVEYSTFQLIVPNLPLGLTLGSSGRPTWETHSALYFSRFQRVFFFLNKQTKTVLLAPKTCATSWRNHVLWLCCLAICMCPLQETQSTAGLNSIACYCSTRMSFLLCESDLDILV